MSKAPKPKDIADRLAKAAARLNELAEAHADLILVTQDAARALSNLAGDIERRG